MLKRLNEWLSEMIPQIKDLTVNFADLVWALAPICLFIIWVLCVIAVVIYWILFFILWMLAIILTALA